MILQNLCKRLIHLHGFGFRNAGETKSLCFPGRNRVTKKMSLLRHWEKCSSTKETCIYIFQKGRGIFFHQTTDEVELKKLQTWKSYLQILETLSCKRTEFVLRGPTTVVDIRTVKERTQRESFPNLKGAQRSQDVLVSNLLAGKSLCYRDCKQ